MTIRDRVRQWLGLEGLITISYQLNSSLATLQDVCNRMETGKAATERHGELIERLERLEQRFTTQHVGTRPASIPVYDWEQVQIQELAEMLANPPKEVE